MYICIDLGIETFFFLRAPGIFYKLFVYPHIPSQ